MSERFEMRVSSELLERLDAARGHEPRASFVKRGLVMLLEVMESAPVEKESSGGGSTSMPTGTKSAAPLGRAGAASSRPASKPFRCPIYDCTFMASSDAAVCGKHGRKVIPS